MSRKTIEIEAKSLEEARAQVKSQTPQGFYLLSEQIILSDEKPKTVRATADTSESAFSQAQGEIPSNAEVLKKREVVAAVQKVITVEAASESDAEVKASSRVKEQFGDAVIISVPKLTITGKNGFLGIGKTPNQYEVEISRKAVIEIVYKLPVKISAEVGDADEIPDDFDTLVSRMLALIKESDRWYEINRPALFKEYPQYDEAQEIGKKFYKMGGRELMAKAYATIEYYANRSRTTMSQHWWDGIGGWYA